MKMNLKHCAVAAGMFFSLLLPTASIQATWQPDVIVSDPILQNTSTQGEPVLSVNPQGNAIAVWTAAFITDIGQNYVFSSFYTRGIGWSPSVFAGPNNALNEFDDPLYNAQNNPDVAMNSSNYAVAVWSGEYSTEPNFPQVILSSTQTSPGVWGPINILSDQSGDFFAQAANVTVNESGLALAVWREQNTSVDPFEEFITISFLPFGGAWTPFFNIDGPNLAQLDDEKPYPKLNDNGDAVVSWKKTFAPNDFGVAVATYKSSTNTWSAPTTLDSGLFDLTGTPRSGIDANGNAVVAWSTDTGIMKAAYFNGTSWGPAQILAGADVSINSANVVMDIHGVATAMWSTLDQIFTSQSVSGGPWSTPVVISQGVNNFSDPHYSQEPLAVDSEGNLIAIWPSSSGNIYSAFKPLNSGWTTPELVSSTPSSLSESVGLADCGFAVSLWFEHPGENGEVRASVNENLLAPTNARVDFRRCCETFATQKVCLNTLTWDGLLPPCIIAYNIYQDGVLIATVTPTLPFIFNAPALKNKQQNAQIVYTISSVNIWGFESDQVPFIPFP